MKTKRIEGLDLARTLAFIGMVVVNFKVVLGVQEEASWLYEATEFLQGKAAALFVVLAGMGLYLSSKKFSRTQLIKRAVFLLAIGFLNSLIFPADIIHYYAFYFFIALFMLHWEKPLLVLAVVVINVVFLVLIMFIKYETGWNWSTMEYEGFWTFRGAARNLIYNGFHPIFPWLGFLLIGVVLAKLDLASRSMQGLLIFTGASALVVAEGMAYTLVIYMDEQASFYPLFSTAPIPPMPLFFLTGLGASLLTIGLCLRLKRIPRWLTAMGRQPLTLYILHIVLGMGLLEEMGYLAKPQTLTFALEAAGICILCFGVYAHLWFQFARQGPLEWLMRKLTR